MTDGKDAQLQEATQSQSTDEPPSKPHSREAKTTKRFRQAQSLLTFLLPFVVMWCFSLSSSKMVKEENVPSVQQCYKTCSIRVVESIPDNITFANGNIPPSTFYAWKRLIDLAENDIYIAAYKSSLQGKHVLGALAETYSREGNEIYSNFLNTGKEGSVKIHMVENYPPKDKGDNADGIILQNHGAVERRSLDIEKKLGRGKMHSKFLLTDNKHFYLGSANLDWRSLNQKMELGVLVENCECLGEDLRRIFGVYWNLYEDKKSVKQWAPALYNMQNPLQIEMEGEKSEVYIATSPKELNAAGRTWDLDAIISEIDGAKEFLDVHVMDYFPLFIYRKPRAHFPAIDDALRRAIVRGVRVRILAAALHYPQIGTRFLRSLESLNSMNENVTVAVKIFKVPPLDNHHKVISRERRTHNKFMVTENAVVIGTSNWSGDYFVGGTTGAAVVIKQNGQKKVMVHEMQDIFQRDWDSDYAHDLEEYYQRCVLQRSADFCESVKDPSLLAKPVVDY